MSVFKPEHRITLGRPHPNGKRYLTSSHMELRGIRDALTKGSRRLKDHALYDQAHLVDDFITRAWNQDRPPFTAECTHQEWQALSLALRSRYLAEAAGTERRAYLQTGHGMPMYQLLVKRREW